MGSWHLGGDVDNKVPQLHATNSVPVNTVLFLHWTSLLFSIAFYSDRDGKLALSSQQKKHFARWVRPEDYISSPQMIMAVSSFSVKQVSFILVRFIVAQLLYVMSG